MADWLLRSAKTLAVTQLPLFERLFDRCIETLTLQPDSGASEIISSNAIEKWATNALNSVGGKLAQAMFAEPRAQKMDERKTFPQTWLDRSEALLNLPGPAASHAAVMYAHNLVFLFGWAKEWVERVFLPLHKNEKMQDAWWAGLEWGIGHQRTFFQRDLFEVLKPHFMVWLQGPASSGESVAGYALSAWATPYKTGEFRINDDELRRALLKGSEEFRVNVIWLIGHYIKDETNDTDWGLQAARLFSDVWPKELVVKSTRVSSSMIELLFKHPAHFTTLLDSLRPHLTKVDRDLNLYGAGIEEASIIELYPREVATLFRNVLPQSVADWPWGIEDTLNNLIKSLEAEDSETAYCRELLRKWQNR